MKAFPLIKDVFGCMRIPYTIYLLSIYLNAYLSIYHVGFITNRY